MAKYQIEVGGQRYEIDAADDAAAQRVMGQIKSRDESSGRVNSEPQDAVGKLTQRLGRFLNPAAPITEPLTEWLNAAPDRPIPVLPKEQTPQGLIRYGQRYRNAALPGGNRIGAASGALIDMVRGEDGSFGDNYNRRLVDEFSRSQAVDRDAGLGDHAATAAGWLTGAYLMRNLPGMKKPDGPTLGPGFGVPPSANALLANQAKDLARVGAGYGMVQSYLDSPHFSTTGKVGDAATGMVGGGMFGAAVGPVVATGGAVVNRLLGGNRPGRREAMQERRADLEDIGIRNPIGPVITDNPAASGAAESLAGSVMGGPLRREVAGNVADANAAIRRTLREGTQGVPVVDNAATTQNFLRRNLYEHSIPREEIASRPIAGLEPMTGPVNPSTGFRPPRPVVDPVTPDYPLPVARRTVTPDEVPVAPVPPEPVPPTPWQTRHSRFNDVPPSAERTRAIDDARGELDRARAQVDVIWNAAREKINTHYATNPKMAQEALDRFNSSGPAYTVAPAERKMLQEASERYWAAEAALKQQNQLAFAERRVELDRRMGSERRGAESAVEESRRRLAAEHEAAASAETRRRQDDAVRTAQQQADADAAARDATNRAAAQNAAEAETRRLQNEADAAWNQQPGGFQLGRSRETYPTEYSAAEEVVGRMTPPFQRNPLGGLGPSGSRTGPTTTERLIDTMAQDLRAEGRLKGYRDGEAIDSGRIAGGTRGTIRPELTAHLSQMLGDNIAERLMSYHASRQAGQMTGGVDGLRRLVTDVRRAAQEAELASRIPGQARNADAIALRRLEGTLNDDLYRFMRESGPQGEVAADMTRQMRGVYRELVEDIRAPLQRLLGRNHAPEDALRAMDHLAVAARDGNLEVLRPFMRVLREKGAQGEAPRAVATLIQHMVDTGGSPGTIRGFIETMASIPRDVRTELASAPGSRQLLANLERLERLLPAVERFERRMAGGDPLASAARVAFNGQHLGLAAFMWVSGHLPAVLAYAGAANGLARFMSSPRYVDWLTRSERVRTPQQLHDWARQLAVIAGNDREMGESLGGLARSLVPGVAGRDPDEPGAATDRARRAGSEALIRTD